MTQRHELQQLFERLFNACHDEGLFRNCTQCMHWAERGEICAKYNVRPPVNVIVRGCKDFQADEIPF